MGLKTLGKSDFVKSSELVKQVLATRKNVETFKTTLLKLEVEAKTSAKKAQELVEVTKRLNASMESLPELEKNARFHLSAMSPATQAKIPGVELL